MFFENLATKCLIEDAVNIGDCFQIGSAKVVVTLPRIPCYNSDLDLEEWTFVRESMVSSGRLGIYFRGIARMQGWTQDLIKAFKSRWE